MKRKILAAFLIIIIALSAYVVLEAGQPVRTRYIPPVRDSERPPSEAASDTPASSAPPITVVPVELQAGDFPISISPDHTVTITNNSQHTVGLRDFKLTYTRGGVALGNTFTNPAASSGGLRPGEAFSTKPAHSNIDPGSISVSIYVRADGQEIMVKYSPTSPPLPVQPIRASDFLITASPYQVTITNNSQSTVQVLELYVGYSCYSYIYYNAPGGGTRYGPIVRTAQTFEEAAVLQPRQSYSRTFNRRDIVAITYCRFTVKDVNTGRTLEVKYG